MTFHITNPLRFIIRSYREKLNFLNIQDVAVTKTAARLFPFSLFSTFYHRFLSNQIFVPFVSILSSRVSEIKNRSVKSVFIAIPCINNTLGGGGGEELKFRKQSDRNVFFANYVTFHRWVTIPDNFLILLFYARHEWTIKGGDPWFHPWWNRIVKKNLCGRDKKSLRRQIFKRICYLLFLLFFVFTSLSLSLPFSKRAAIIVTLFVVFRAAKESRR